MRCPKCNTENRDDARFCRKCGLKLSWVCSQCGQELLVDAQFCDACGAPVDASSPASMALPAHIERLIPKEYAQRLLATRGQGSKERRTVTILFCDVKGSTSMAENLDPEDWTEIMEGAFEVLIEPVYRYEGTLAPLMGDAVLAFFGAPIAHEDDPERACRAALDIIAGVKQYAARLQQERGIYNFNVRVGINTGLVVVGEVGSDLCVEYTAMGDAVNLAARLQSAAEPGTVLISEATHKLIAPLFETEALGPIEVKGKAEPVPVYRVLGAKPVAAKPRGIPGLQSPLVGREAEFAALQEALERLQAGVGGIVTIVGEAGIGKSRLVAELRNLPRVIASEAKQSPPRQSEMLHSVQHDKPRPVQWVEGRCLSYGGTMAYGLWLDVLRALVGVTLDDSPNVVRVRLHQRVQALCADRYEEVHSYLTRLMSLELSEEEQGGLGELDGQDLKTHTFRAIELLIECAASERPLVLVCEDLHWADPTSIELLERLLALTDHASLLLICAFRPLKEHGSWNLREAVARDYTHRHTDIGVKPLSAGDSAVLVGNLLEVEQLAPRLKERILEVAEGNPFYVEEVIRSLLDQQAILWDEASDRWVAADEAVEIALPDSLQGVLMARIDRLQEDTKRVLQMASVIGRIFLYRILQAIAEEEQRLDDHLVTLQRQEMIRERARIPELEYIFKHELTREAAYNGLPKKDRRAFHRQVAEALERLFPERVEEQMGLLAHHWERARDADRAIEYLLRAGDQARNAYAHQEAVGYYTRALSLLKQQGEHERAARTWMKLGLTHHTAFEFREAHDAYHEGFVLWQRASAEQPAVPPAPAPHALRTVLDEPSSLDPAINWGEPLILQLFSGLVEFTADWAIVPSVARRWEVLNGGCRYLFLLRDDVCWSDGVPLTARDFEYAWKRLLDPATGSAIASLLYDIRGAKAFHEGISSDSQQVGVSAVDDHTLVIELEGPTGYFLHLLGMLAFPVPQHVVQAHGEAWTNVEHFVTNGPFQLQAWHSGQSMLLVRNPHYHGRFSGNLQQVQVSFLWKSPRQLEMYEADCLDMLLAWGLPIPGEDKAALRHADDWVSLPFPSTFGVKFDVTRPPFDDRRVRRAFALATDRERLAAVLTGGINAPATGGLVPHAMPGHSPGIGLPYDPEQARQLLAEAGYPGGHGFPAVDAVAYENNVHYAKYLQPLWRDLLGVEIPWKIGQWSTIPKPGEMPHLWMFGGPVAYPDPHFFLSGWQLSRFGWRNQPYDALVDHAKRMTDQEERMSLYRQAERILIEDAVVLPTAYGQATFLLKPWVRKLPATAVGWLQWKDVIIEPH